MHEPPEIPNYGKRGRGKKFINGMVIAIEPMINLGTKNIRHFSDGWTIKTADNLPSAHFEHNVALINGKPQLLSTFDYIYEALGIKSDEEIPLKNLPIRHEVDLAFFFSIFFDSYEYIFSTTDANLFMEVINSLILLMVLVTVSF